MINRRAKLKRDDDNFMGALLHVTYAPEFESLEDARGKLEQRRVEVLTRTHGTTGGAQHREPYRPPKRPLLDATTTVTDTIAMPALSTASNAHDRNARRHKRARGAPAQEQLQPTSSSQSSLLAIRNKLSAVRSPSAPGRSCRCVHSQ
jgi:hypothetical protein